MSDKPKFPRADALAVAKEICGWLKPLCEELRVAGSLRRGKLEVGDVEIVYVPKYGELPDPEDLLKTLKRTNLVDYELSVRLGAGALAKRPNKNGHFTWGAENKLAIHTASGIPVDFFGGNKSNFWTLLVCRTGSRENNERICNAAIARGLKWDPYAGFCDRVSQQLLFVPRSEQEVFSRVGLPYPEPNRR